MYFTNQSDSSCANPAAGEFNLPSLIFYLPLPPSRYANIDLKTQEAYELAVKGLIRPMEKGPPLITAVRTLQFAPPEFQLEIHCLHETQQYLRKIVHEIGLEMKSVAVCTQVRRIRDGIFTLEDALLRTQWNLHNIQNAILKSKLRVETEIQKSLAYEGEEETRAAPVTGGTQLSEGEDASPPMIKL